MNKLFYFLLLSGLHGFSQSTIIWDDPIVVSDTTGYYHPRIGLDANSNPVIIWGFNESVYFSRWDISDFTDPVALNPIETSVFATSWAGPDLATSGDTIYVVYKANPEDLERIYLVHSYDGGITFSEPVIVDGMLGDDISRFPSVAANSDGQPLVSFMKLNSSFLEPRYVISKSTDGGNSFAMDVLASDFSGGEVCDCCPAGITANENYVVNLYRDNLDNLRNSWAAISNDGGSMFMNGLQIDQTDWIVNACPSSGPDGIIIDDSLYSVFMSAGNGTNRVYFSRSSLSSLSDGEDIRLKNDFDGLMIQNYPRIANYGNAAAVVWKQNANSSSEIPLLFTSDISNGFPVNYDTVAFMDIYGLENADVAVSANAVHVVWQNSSSDQVLYRKGIYASPEVTITKNNLLSYKLSIYPNPAQSITQISIDGNEQIESIQVCRFDGSVIFEQEEINVSNYSLSTINFNAGTYLISIEDKSGNRYNAALIKI
jgi:hypothetical protein